MKAVRSVEFYRVEMYWKMGERIFNEEQQGKERADYGTYLLRTLAKEIEPEYGSGFSLRQLERCRQFYRTFPIATAVRTQLNWSQYKMLIAIFRIIISLGVATDMHLNAQKSGYETTHTKLQQFYRPAATVWYSTQATVPEQQLKLDISETPSDFCDADTLILSIAIEFGELDAFGNPVAMKYGGAGKILGTK